MFNPLNLKKRLDPIEKAKQFVQKLPPMLNEDPLEDKIIEFIKLYIYEALNHLPIEKKEWFAIEFTEENSVQFLNAIKKYSDIWNKILEWKAGYVIPYFSETKIGPLIKKLYKENRIAKKRDLNRLKLK
jgi:hypothetical protein